MNQEYQDHGVSGVKFEDTGYQAVKYYRETSTPKIINAVMKLSGGSIKNERQAEYILFGLAVLAIGVSLFLFFGYGSGITGNEDALNELRISNPELFNKQ